MKNWCNVNVKEHAIYLYLLLSTGFTLQPLTQSLIKYTCGSGQNQKATVTFPVSFLSI